MKYHPDKNPDEGERVTISFNHILDSILTCSNSLKRFLMPMKSSQIQILAQHMTNMERKDLVAAMVDLACLLMNYLQTYLEVVLVEAIFMEDLLLVVLEREKQ